MRYGIETVHLVMQRANHDLPPCIEFILTVGIPDTAPYRFIRTIAATARTTPASLFPVILSL